MPERWQTRQVNLADECARVVQPSAKSTASVEDAIYAIYPYNMPLYYAESH